MRVLFPFLTPYQYASNSPIACIDLEGLQADRTFNPTEEIAKRTALVESIKKNPGSKKNAVTMAQINQVSIAYGGADGPTGGKYNAQAYCSDCMNLNGTKGLVLNLKLKTAEQIKKDVEEIVAERNKENNPDDVTGEDPPTDNTGTDDGADDVDNGSADLDVETDRSQSGSTPSNSNDDDEEEEPPQLPNGTAEFDGNQAKFSGVNATQANRALYAIGEFMSKNPNQKYTLNVGANATKRTELVVDKNSPYDGKTVQTLLNGRAAYAKRYIKHYYPNVDVDKNIITSTKVNDPDRTFSMAPVED